MIPKGPWWRTPAAYAKHLTRRVELEQNNVNTLLGALLGRAPLELAAAVEQSPAGRSVLRGSCACRQSDFSDPWFGYWCKRLRAEPRFHRKYWEFYFVCDALHRAGVLRPGKRGLGFGVGREPLSALFASLGADVVATDMGRERAVEIGWATSDEHAAQLSALNERGICPSELFADRVRLREADMKQIPNDLVDFDFCWSACALEHLGSLQQGLDFVERSLECLHPGGVAVHTTELNLSSNRRTLARGRTVLYRRRDLEGLRRRLTERGHAVEPLDFDAGDGPLDHFIDVPPYRDHGHLKLLLERYTSTSFGLVVRRGYRR